MPILKMSLLNIQVHIAKQDNIFFAPQNGHPESRRRYRATLLEANKAQRSEPLPEARSPCTADRGKLRG
jgi:hypothetical protein